MNNYIFALVVMLACLAVGIPTYVSGPHIPEALAPEIASLFGSVLGAGLVILAFSFILGLFLWVPVRLAMSTEAAPSWQSFVSVILVLAVIILLQTTYQHNHNALAGIMLVLTLVAVLLYVMLWCYATDRTTDFLGYVLMAWFILKGLAYISNDKFNLIGTVSNVFSADKTSSVMTNQQEHCRDQAEQFIERIVRNETHAHIKSYNNHYNSRLSRCFALVIDTPKNEQLTLTHEELWDINENKSLGDIIYESSHRESAYCEFIGCGCVSKDIGSGNGKDWDNLVNPYMEE